MIKSATIIFLTFPYDIERSHSAFTFMLALRTIPAIPFLHLLTGKAGTKGQLVYFGFYLLCSLSEELFMMQIITLKLYTPSLSTDVDWPAIHFQMFSVQNSNMCSNFLDDWASIWGVGLCNPFCDIASAERVCRPLSKRFYKKTGT